jgi:hypothetical protein
MSGRVLIGMLAVVLLSGFCCDWASGATKPRAPSGPPLTSGGTTGTSQTQNTQVFSGDPLVENGLGSPMCSLSGGAGGLSPQAQSNCRTSDWVAAAAPISNYAFDVNAGGSFLGLSAQSLFQQYLLAPVWMGLVWAVHALLSMLEWAYTIDLLDSPAQSGLGQALRQTQGAFTQPWLVLALAISSVLAAYHGLVRRRVAQTVGDVLMMGAMMLGGLWVIANPTGTVGVVGQVANEASLGALSVFAQGSPSEGTRTFADGMRSVFAQSIEGPWCYMEFGDVQWCRDPAELDARLHSAALRLAAAEQSVVGCKMNNSFFHLCVPIGSTQARAYVSRAELLHGAQTNGELFLALPAGGSERNGIAEKEDGLLTELCGGPGTQVGSCRGPTAAQADFRGSAGTEQRTAGLALIVAGNLGMLLLLGFLALHLLAAALMSLFYLLLAPAAVLAPALGDGGRQLFRSWATRLLGALVAKLVYSLVLGAMLAMERILLGLPGLGWWPQWLLVGTAWWGVFLHRHRALGLVEGRRPRYVFLQRSYERNTVRVRT